MPPANPTQTLPPSLRTPHQATPPTTATIDSRALMGTAREVAILHGGATYRLQATRQGKLILTK